MIEKKKNVSISGFFMSISRFLPIKEYLWIVNKRWSKVARIAEA